MFEKLKTLLLRFLRVPPEPEPPFGDPASIRIFRASRKLYVLRLVGWAFTQLAALVGILFWLGVIVASEREANRMRSQNLQGGVFMNLKEGRNQVVMPPLGKVPPQLFAWLWFLKGIGVLVYLSQLAISYAAVRLDYELRWYIVTDRSLRIRSGLWSVQEVTMSFANLQQVVITQGPLERLLGIANVRVQSAGGGGKSPAAGKGKAEPMHNGIFHGVENAGEIRDLIVERLRRFRETGLGDPDERIHHVTAASGPNDGPGREELLNAAKELLSEARQLKSAVCAPASERT
jgi:membrane protein YdbS with pleckstrin-like domain